MNNLLNDILETQKDTIAHEKAEKIAQKEHTKRVKETWQLMRDTLAQMEKDFEAFEGVEFNPYFYRNVPYEHSIYNVYKQYENFKIKKTEGRYGSWGFTAKNGTICAEVSFFASNAWKFKVQIEKHPDSDDVKYYFENHFYTYDEIKKYLDIPKDKAYSDKKMLVKRNRCFYSYGDFRDHLMGFFKKTVNVDSFKEKNCQIKHIKEETVLKFKKA